MRSMIRSRPAATGRFRTCPYGSKIARSAFLAQAGKVFFAELLLAALACRVPVRFLRPQLPAAYLSRNRLRQLRDEFDAPNAFVWRQLLAGEAQDVPRRS